jgi:selenocysteine-specific elongation factor
LYTLRTGTFAELFARAGLEETIARQALAELKLSGQLTLVEEHRLKGQEIERLPQDTLAASRPYWEALIAGALAEADVYHRNFPLRRGMPREELKSRLSLPPRLFSALLGHLVAEGSLIEQGPIVHRREHTISFSSQQKVAIETLLGKFNSAPFAPPSVKESQAEIGEDVYAALVEDGVLIQVSSDVVFERSGYMRLVDEVRALIQNNGPLTAAQARDHFNTSRKYVLALLEHLDASGVTARSGDTRSLK